MDFERKLNLGGVPERFIAEGVFAHNRTLVKVGDEVEALVNLKSGVSKGTRAKILEIVVEPLGEHRGFNKRIRLEGCLGEHNPKKFKKV